MFDAGLRTPLAEDIPMLRVRAAEVTAALQRERCDPQIPRRDLSPYAAGNTGVPHVFSFDSGRPGPHALVTCLAHGNEPGGLEAVIALLDRGIRPRAGRLTLAMCNIAAYVSSNGVDPYGIRFIEEDFNRVWSNDILDSDRKSLELDRARLLRPFVTSADLILDLHATPYEATPYFVLRPGSRAVALAERMSQPRTHFIFNQGSAHSPTLANYPERRDPDGSALGVTIECGLFFARSSADVALSTVAEALALHGVIDAGVATTLTGWRDRAERRTVIIDETQPTRTGRVTFLCKPGDFRGFAAGEIVAFDGEEPIRAPFDGATPLWVKQTFIAGDTAFMWARQAVRP